MRHEPIRLRFLRQGGAPLTSLPLAEQMSGMQRRKGATGELEIAGIVRDLTGWDVRRRVRNHAGDSDLVGIPGWSVEVKRHKAAGRALIARWWLQSCAQASGVPPVLFYRLDRDSWRAVWPLAVSLKVQHAAMWSDYAWTCEGSIEAWAAVARDV